MFADCPGQLIGDSEILGVDPEEPNPEPDDLSDDVELPGVDTGELQPNQTPQIAEIDDLDIPDADPPCTQAAPVVEEPASSPKSESPVSKQEPTTQELPEATSNMPPTAEAPPLRRSSGSRTQTKHCTPSMSSTKCSHAAMQLANEGLLHPDAHVFIQEDFCQAKPEAVAMIMTHMSLKAGLKAWGERATKAAHSEMKQLHMRNTFEPMHW